MKPIPDFQTLYGRFPDADGIPEAVSVSPDGIPEPYRSLLVHSLHMTVTVERFYGDRVDVCVLETRTDGAEYSRKILLALAGDGRVVQFGIVFIDLDLLAPAVRQQIVEGRTPLGRVLIQNEVLREVRATGFVKVTPNATMRGWFGMAEIAALYGRLGVITADGQPAIEVLEVLAPATRINSNP